MTTQDAAQPAAGSPRPTALRSRRLVGRDLEIAEVTETVLSSQVTTLIGPDGVGKTALATTVAATVIREAFADGVAVVLACPLALRRARCP